MITKSLEKPDDDTVEAFAKLNDDRFFNKIIDYLELCRKGLINKWKASNSERVDCEYKGAVQVIDGLVEINARSVEWMGKIYQRNNKREG